jgi:hypothetical protein
MSPICTNTLLYVERRGLNYGSARRIVNEADDVDDGDEVVKGTTTVIACMPMKWSSACCCRSATRFPGKKTVKRVGGFRKSQRCSIKGGLVAAFATKSAIVSVTSLHSHVVTCSDMQVANVVVSPLSSTGPTSTLSHNPGPEVDRCLVCIYSEFPSLITWHPPRSS